MTDGRISFTDVGYGQWRRVSRREEFVAVMDRTIAWAQWVTLVEPRYYSNTGGRKSWVLETMPRI